MSMEEIKCPRCSMVMEVSEEDSDATLGEMLEHITVRHAGYSRPVAMDILAEIR